MMFRKGKALKKPTTGEKDIEQTLKSISSSRLLLLFPIINEYIYPADCCCLLVMMSVFCAHVHGVVAQCKTGNGERKLAIGLDRAY